MPVPRVTSAWAALSLLAIHDAWSVEENTWEMFNGDVLTLRKTAGGHELVNSNGAGIIDFREPLRVKGSVASRNRKFLVLYVVAERKIGELAMGYNYSQLALASFDAKRGWVAKRLMPWNGEALDFGKAWIWELKDISDSGTDAILRVGGTLDPAGTGTVWRVADIENGLWFAEGVIPDGFGKK